MKVSRKKISMQKFNEKKVFLAFFENSYNISKRQKSLIAFANTKNENMEESVFFNFPFDKGRLKNIVCWFFEKHGQYKTLKFLEKLKEVGFGSATNAGISLGIDDLKIPDKKVLLLSVAETKVAKDLLHYRNAQITGIERIQRLIYTWNQTNDTLKQEVVRLFETTDLLNPIYMMAFSGARGNMSQVRQLVGMRGLMSDPQGQIIDFPIQSNFREGLTLTEYLISTYGARKGIVDTALRTATAGYLTRRLVDVAQHTIVSKFDCGTMRGIFLFDMKDGKKTIYSFQNRLIGRVLAQNIENFDPLHSRRGSGLEDVCFAGIQLNVGKKQIAFRNQEIDSKLAQALSKITKKAFVRSPLTCETSRFVCQLCYGWSFSHGKLVSVGEAVGIIAAQSIGEPGTQLTMRTFHTGGVFAGGLTDQILAPYDGKIKYFQNIPGTCVRNSLSDIAFFTKMPGSFFVQKNQVDSIEQQKSSLSTKKGLALRPSGEIYRIPAYALLFCRNNEIVQKKQVLAQFSSVLKKMQYGRAEQTLYSTLAGEFVFGSVFASSRSMTNRNRSPQNQKVSAVGEQVLLLEKRRTGDFSEVELKNDILWKSQNWTTVWILSGNIFNDSCNKNFPFQEGYFFKKTSVINRILWKKKKRYTYSGIAKKKSHKKVQKNSQYLVAFEKKKTNTSFFSENNSHGFYLKTTLSTELGKTKRKKEDFSFTILPKENYGSFGKIFSKNKKFLKTKNVQTNFFHKVDSHSSGTRLCAGLCFGGNLLTSAEEKVPVGKIKKFFSALFFGDTPNTPTISFNLEKANDLVFIQNKSNRFFSDFEKITIRAHPKQEVKTKNKKNSIPKKGFGKIENSLFFKFLNKRKNTGTPLFLNISTFQKTFQISQKFGFFSYSSLLPKKSAQHFQLNMQFQKYLYFPSQIAKSNKTETKEYPFLNFQSFFISSKKQKEQKVLNLSSFTGMEKKFFSFPRKKKKSFFCAKKETKNILLKNSLLCLPIEKISYKKFGYFSSFSTFVHGTDKNKKMKNSFQTFSTLTKNKTFLDGQRNIGKRENFFANENFFGKDAPNYLSYCFSQNFLTQRGGIFQLSVYEQNSKKQRVFHFLVDNFFEQDDVQMFSFEPNFVEKITTLKMKKPFNFPVFLYLENFFKFSNLRYTKNSPKKSKKFIFSSQISRQIFVFQIPTFSFVTLSILSFQKPFFLSGNSFLNTKKTTLSSFKVDQWMKEKGQQTFVLNSDGEILNSLKDQKNIPPSSKNRENNSNFDFSKKNGNGLKENQEEFSENGFDSKNNGFHGNGSKKMGNGNEKFIVIGGDQYFPEKNQKQTFQNSLGGNGFSSEEFAFVHFAFSKETLMNRASFRFSNFKSQIFEIHKDNSGVVKNLKNQIEPSAKSANIQFFDFSKNFYKDNERKNDKKKKNSFLYNFSFNSCNNAENVFLCSEKKDKSSFFDLYTKEIFWLPQENFMVFMSDVLKQTFSNFYPFHFHSSFEKNPLLFFVNRQGKKKSFLSLQKFSLLRENKKQKEFEGFVKISKCKHFQSPTLQLQNKNVPVGVQKSFFPLQQKISFFSTKNAPFKKRFKNKRNKSFQKNIVLKFQKRTGNKNFQMIQKLFSQNSFELCNFQEKSMLLKNSSFVGKKFANHCFTSLPFKNSFLKRKTFSFKQRKVNVASHSVLPRKKKFKNSVQTNKYRFKIEQGWLIYPFSSLASLCLNSTPPEQSQGEYTQKSRLDKCFWKNHKKIQKKGHFFEKNLTFEQNNILFETVVLENFSSSVSNLGSPCSIETDKISFHIDSLMTNKKCRYVSLNSSNQFQKQKLNREKISNSFFKNGTEKNVFLRMPFSLNGTGQSSRKDNSPKKSPDIFYGKENVQVDHKFLFVAQKKESKKNRLHFLRPFQYKVLENPKNLKKFLKNIRVQHFSQIFSASCFQLYKKYHSTFFNPQQKLQKFLEKNPNFDFDILSTFQDMYFSQSHSPFISFSQQIEQNHFKKNISKRQKQETFLQDKKEKNLFLKQKSTDSLEQVRKNFFVFNQPGDKNKENTNNFSFYPIQFLALVFSFSSGEHINSFSTFPNFSLNPLKNTIEFFICENKAPFFDERFSGGHLLDFVQTSSFWLNKDSMNFLFSSVSKPIKSEKISMNFTDTSFIFQKEKYTTRQNFVSTKPMAEQNFETKTKLNFFQNSVFQKNRKFYGSTEFLSPYEGELLSMFTHDMYWWKKASEISTLQKFKKLFTIITKKDFFSVQFPLETEQKAIKNLSFEQSFLKMENSIANKKIATSLKEKQKHLAKLYETILKTFEKTKFLTFSRDQKINVFDEIGKEEQKKTKISSFLTQYENKIYTFQNLMVGYPSPFKKPFLGNFVVYGDNFFGSALQKPGQIIHLSFHSMTLRCGQPCLVSSNGILHFSNTPYIKKNVPLVTLPYQTVQAGDIVQGIPKVEQIFEARTSLQGRLFVSSLPILLKGIFERYRVLLPLEQAACQSFLKIQQIIVDGVQRVYRSQGVSITDKHLEVVVRQMTTKVQILHGAQTGFFPGELVNLDLVERINKFLMVKIRYEPVILGITRASLEVDSFLSASSFQQTTKILSFAAISRKKDFLKGLKENLLVGNLIPSGTGYFNLSKKV